MTGLERSFTGTEAGWPFVPTAASAEKEKFAHGLQTTFDPLKAGLISRLDSINSKLRQLSGPLERPKFDLNAFRDELRVLLSDPELRAEEKDKYARAAETILQAFIIRTGYKPSAN